MPVTPPIAPAPTPRERFKELLVAQFGWIKCRHDYRIVQTRTHLFLRCLHCGQTTEGFRVAGIEQ